MAKSDNMEVNGKHEIVDKGSNSLQYFAGIAANLGIMSSQMHFAWTSATISLLMNGSYTFTISSEESSWLVVTPLLGAVVGALITSAIVDIFGRKMVIVCSSIPLIASWLLIAWARSSALMFTARFIAGMMDGLSFTAVPMYLGEIADPEIRGVISSACPICIILGYLSINLLGSFLSIITTAYVSTVIPILFLATFIWMPESPYFYLIKGRTEEARQSLQRLKGIENVDEELHRITEAIVEQTITKVKPYDLVSTKKNRRAVLIAFGVRTVQQLSGTSAVMFYCKVIFEKSSDFIPSSYATIIYFSVQLIVSSVASILADHYGRRPLLITSIIGTATALFLNGTYLYLKDETDVVVSSYNFIPLLSLLAFIIMYSIGLQTVPYLIMAEVFSTDIKAVALCAADIYFSIIVTIITKMFSWVNDHEGMYVSFYAFGVCSVLGLFFIIVFIPETKGKTLEVIQEELKAK